MVDAFPFKQDDPQTWPLSSRLVRHAIAAVGFGEEFKLALDAAAHLANQAGLYLCSRGQLSAAEALLRRALAIDEKVYGPDHPSVATRANNVGQILKVQGDLDGALRYTERALRILEQTYGRTNPLTKAAAANLAAIRHQMKAAGAD